MPVPGQGGGEPVNNDPKSLKIIGLGLPAEGGIWSGKGIWAEIRRDINGDKVADGWAGFGEPEAVIKLEAPSSSDLWTGSGEYFLYVTIQNDENYDDDPQYFYSGGDPIPSDFLSGIKKFTFIQGPMEVDFSKFAKPGD